MASYALIDMPREKFYKIAKMCAETALTVKGDPVEYWEWVDTKNGGNEETDRMNYMEGALLSKLSPMTFKKYARMALLPEKYGEIPDIIFDPNRTHKPMNVVRKKSNDQKIKRSSNLYYKRFSQAREYLAEQEKRLKEQENQEEEPIIEDDQAENGNDAFDLPIL